LSDRMGMHEISLFPLESFESEGDRIPLEGVDENGCGCIKLPVARNPGGHVKKKGRKGSDPDVEKEEDPKERLARIEREAYEKGFEQGQKDGMALEQRQMEERGKQLAALIDALGRLRERIYSEAEGEVVKLSLAIAKKIIRGEVKAGNHLIEETIRSAMKLLVDRSHVRIRISPADMEEVTRLVPALAAGAQAGRLQIVEDSAVERGGCILETGFGSVNAGIEDQLSVVEKELDRCLEASRGVPS
jgi:flagellar assembly protein FliH